MMARRILTLLLASVCLSGFTIAQKDWDRERPIPNDIQIDQDPVYVASGDGKYWTSDDEDYGVSGSGSGSGAGALDVEDDKQFEYELTRPRPDVLGPSSTTTTTQRPVTARPKSKCELHREATMGRLTAYVPKCHPDTGAYAALQCEGSPGTSDCWCVGLNGGDIAGTMMYKPDYPDCDNGYNLGKCTFELVKKHRSSMLGARHPQCTGDGNYEEVQCRGSICFCVDIYSGVEKPGSQVHLPEQPRCSVKGQDNFETTTKRLRPDVKETGRDQDKIEIEGEIDFPRLPTDTIDLDQFDDNENTAGDVGEDDRSDSDGDVPLRPGSKFDEDGTEDEEQEADQEERGRPDRKDRPDSSHGHKDRVQKAGEILTQPGILAGIIGGAVVLLLCLVLLLMFVVYRMRKKDEGSYPLDEPRRGPPNYNYVRAPDREYYA